MEEIFEEQEVDLATAIEQYEQIRGASEEPWYCNKFSRDEYDCGYMEVGPYPIEGRYANPDVNNYYESCIATFSDNHNAEANAKLAVAAVNLAPRLIARIRELEAKTATGLSEDVAIAIEALKH